MTGRGKSPIIGKWRIVSSDLWDRDFLDLVDVGLGENLLDTADPLFQLVGDEIDVPVLCRAAVLLGEIKGLAFDREAELC